MPTRERVQALIDLVEGGRYVEAIEAFYHEDASMQENLDPPRRGRVTLVTGERRVIEAHHSIRTRPVHTFMVEGDRAVINWVIDFVDHEGRAYTLDGLPSSSGAASGSSRSASTTIRRSVREAPRRDELPPGAAISPASSHAAGASVARMKRSKIRGGETAFPAAPHSASLHAGYQGDFTDRRAPEASGEWSS